MKEFDFIKIIKDQSRSEYIGDDCAYLKDIGIVVTQDNFVEDVHFKREWATPWQIGYKATVVNISDVLASGAKPAYITVGLSIPNDVDENFIKEFYRGVESGSYGAKLVGGDITGGDKIFVSITAIGKTEGRNISSRSHAKAGYKIVARGNFGESSKGLKELMEGKRDSDLIRAHLEPKLDPQFSEDISQIKEQYAMMDTSDGLADALFKIAQASKVTIKTDYIEGMFGAEDYKLVAAVPSDLDIEGVNVLGEVLPFDVTYLRVGDKEYKNYDELGMYSHW